LADLVVRGVLTKPCDFGKNSESLDVKDWVDKRLLVPRLVMISLNFSEIKGRSNVGRAWADLRVLLQELEGEEKKA
jgi:hypothetical protein